MRKFVMRIVILAALLLQGCVPGHAAGGNTDFDTGALVTLLP